jgi:hypothetical protein
MPRSAVEKALRWAETAPKDELEAARADFGRREFQGTYSPTAEPTSATGVSTPATRSGPREQRYGASSLPSPVRSKSRVVGNASRMR